MVQALDEDVALSVRELMLMRRGRLVLDRVSLDARAGEVVAILGPNGAGKSTLLGAIAGLHPGCEGEVSHNGRPLGSLATRSRALWYMPDEVTLPDEVSLALAVGLPTASSLAAELRLEGLLRCSASDVSRGEAKRAQLAAALASGRAVLLLDEPFGAFDPRELRRVVSVFRRHLGRASALVSVHQMHVAEQCADRLLLLVEGRVVAFGTLDELRALASVSPDTPLDQVFLRLLEGPSGALS